MINIEYFPFIRFVKVDEMSSFLWSAKIFASVSLDWMKKNKRPAQRTMAEGPAGGTAQNNSVWEIKCTA